MSIAFVCTMLQSIKQCRIFTLHFIKEIRKRHIQSGRQGGKKEQLVQPVDQSASPVEGEGMVGSTIGNLVVIIGFAFFAYTVKAVISAVGSS